MRNVLSRLLLLGIFTGCDGSTDPVMCTKELRFGIQMEVVNAESGNPSAAGATMTLNEGAYFESTVGIEDNSMLIGAPERAGTLHRYRRAFRVPHMDSNGCCSNR